MQTPVAKGASQKIQLLRIGVYQRYWGGNADEGWTRLVLEQYGFPYTTIRDADICSGNLRDSIDVLVLPHDSSALITGQVTDYWEKQIANKPYVLFPPEFRSGIGDAGVECIKAFVELGGKLVTLGKASNFAIEKFELELTNVTKDKSATDFYCPGSTLRAVLDVQHPVCLGMKSNAYLVYYDSAAFDVPVSNKKYSVAATYADKDILQSGWLIGEETIAGKAAVVSVQVGQGEVVLLGCRVQNRAQTDGSYKLLFNNFYQFCQE